MFGQNVHSVLEALLDEHQVNEWNVLIVDDEEDVHKLTRLALSQYRFEEKPIQLLSAFSAEDAKIILAKTHDIAIIILDVVMETRTAGLELVDHIRNVLGNRQVRIILRTGQPGAAPEKSVVERYDINDYKEKSELTSNKLYTAIRCALRAYLDIKSIEKKRAAVEWALNEKLRADKAKSAFLSNVNHEFRTPLNAILGYSEILCLQTFGPLGSERYLGYAQSINQSGKSLLTTFEQLLQVSDAADDCDPTQEDESVFDLWGVVSECLETVLPGTYRSQGTSRRPNVVNLNLHARRSSVVQVVSEILTNAFKHNSAGGKVTVGILRREDSSAVIVIRDNGPGIPESVIQNLGKPFNTDSAVYIQKSRGLGLGLALSSQIVISLGGQIVARNLVPNGAEVAIVFPASRLSEDSDRPESHT